MKSKSLFKYIGAVLVLCGLLITPAPFTPTPSVKAVNTTVAADEFPADLPATPMPDLKGCSSDQEIYLKKAWRRSHSYTWRAHKLVEHIFSHNASQREDLWNADYVEGVTAVTSLRTWFGAYTAERAQKVREALEKARKRFEHKGEVVKGINTIRCGSPLAPQVDEHTDICPDKNPGADGPPGGYHAPVGTIVTCPPFWNGNANNNFIFPDQRLDYSARSLAHETFHWLSVDGKYVTDKHGGRKDKFYGQQESLALAKANPDWAIYNNDNYAWFVYHVGRSEPTYSAVWGPKDPGGVGGFFVDLSWEELIANWNKLAPNQYLNDVETYVKNGERKYMAVWRVGKGSGALWTSEWDDFAKKWNELKKTQDLIDVEVYKSGDKWMYLGIYKVKDPGVKGDGGLLVGLSWEELIAKWKAFTDVAYLVDVETYVAGGKRQFIGVWRAGKGNGDMIWTKGWTDFGATKKKLDPSEQLIDFEKFLTPDGKWNYLGVWHLGKGGAPIALSMPLSKLFQEREENKAKYTLLKVEDYSPLPTLIK